MRFHFALVVFLSAWLVACQATSIPLSLQPSITPSPTPTPRPLPTPLPADRFDFPLDPDQFGPYVHNVSGPLNVDTRYGVQNPGLGSAGKCFVDRNGKKVPFAELYHAGEDWFKVDARRQVDPGAARGEVVRAVANGLVTWKQDIGAEGWVITIEHLLADGSKVWSAYWHVVEPTVSFGQIVYRGEMIGKVADLGGNAHVHWEIRTWSDGSICFRRRAQAGAARAMGGFRR
jgi:murein DD-endopeptidase MepM/ murein hydrolase activator NlpD